MIKWFSCVLCLVISWYSVSVRASNINMASHVFDTFRSSVFQVQVIDRGSNTKSSIGSGFLLGKGDVIATNYHVISLYVQKPEEFRILVVDQHKGAVAAKVVNFDVVHDLAILNLERPLSARTFRLANTLPKKGDRIYSLGNPFDLAMTIIEGIHNGLVDGTRYEQYLFSGSLNSGMSGGPALNLAGDVIGVNVAKGQEQISFLVPVSHVLALLSDDTVLEPSQYQSHIAHAVKTHLMAYYDQVLMATWKIFPLGGYQYPEALHDSIKCWGHTLEKDRSLFDEVHRHCQTQDQIFLNDNLSVGLFSYDLGYVTADGLNRFQFYHLLAENFSVNTFQFAEASEITAGACLDDYVRLHEMTWRVTRCARAYKRIPGLYDAELIAQRIDLPLASARMRVSIVGIGLEQMRAMHRRFLEHARWEN